MCVLNNGSTCRRASYPSCPVVEGSCRQHTPRPRMLPNGIMSCSPVCPSCSNLDSHMLLYATHLHHMHTHIAHELDIMIILYMCTHHNVKKASTLHTSRSASISKLSSTCKLMALLVAHVTVCSKCGYPVQPKCDPLVHPKEAPRMIPHTPDHDKQPVSPLQCGCRWPSHLVGPEFAAARPVTNAQPAILTPTAAQTGGAACSNNNSSSDDSSSDDRTAPAFSNPRQVTYHRHEA